MQENSDRHHKVPGKGVKYDLMVTIGVEKRSRTALHRSHKKKSH